MSEIIKFRNKSAKTMDNNYKNGLLYLSSLMELGLCSDFDIEKGIRWLQSKKKYNIESKKQDEMIDVLIKQLHYRNGMIIPKHLIEETNNGILAKCPICSTLIKFDTHCRIFCYNCGQKLEI